MGTAERSLGELLRRHRARLGVTQEELAERAGISARTISDVERGLRSSMYRDTADRLAAALELNDEERTTLLHVGRPRRAHRIGLADHPAPIPMPPSSIIGRQEEVAAATGWVRTAESRLVVITGPGGIGKTRLAVEIALALRADLPDGVAFIDLSGTSDPRLLPAVIADAVAIAQLREPLRDRIVDQLRHRELLVVLDTFERLVDGAALLADILASCPGVRMLVTSRIPLRLRGERDVPLGPLEVTDDLDRAGDAPALSLFAERALSVRPDLQLDAGPPRREVIAICRRLDGIPLAIELAAARVRHLPLAGLREALDVPLAVLADGPRDAPDRQRSMRDAVAWSYDLLARPDQQLLRQLSIFAGGWTAPSAALVAGSDDRATFAGCSRLVDHSLVSMTEDVDGGPRFRMFDVIREFAAERRDAANESEALSRRHAEHFVDVAEAEEPQLRAAGQNTAAVRLAADNDNLRQALRWCLSNGDATLALRLSGALWPFWRRRGDLVEGRAWLEEALALPHAPDEVRAKALWGAAWLALHQGDFDRSEALGAELRAAGSEMGDALAMRNGTTVLAKVATARGRHDEAVVLCEAALETCRDLGPSWQLATSVFNLGTAVLHTGDFDRAETLFIEAVDRYRSLGDEIFAARVTGYLGYPALLRDDPEGARHHMLDALDRFIEMDDAWGIAEALERVSALEAATGNLRLAAEIAGAGARARETVLIDPMLEEQEIIAPYLRAARASLGHETWQDAFDRGRELTPEGARSAVASP